MTNEAGLTAWATTPLFEVMTGNPGWNDRGPVLLSVPHAGRSYTPAVLERSRMPLADLQRLEDRHADLLITDLVSRGYRAVVAHVPRAVIDLNRDPRDIDPNLVRDIPHGQPLIQSLKQRGGLGLFPRSLPRIGDLWRGAMPWEEARSRIALMHARYHEALERELEDIYVHHGQALLVDVHSMPPLAPSSAGVGAGVAAGTGGRPDVVIGDRFGGSASNRLSETARDALMAEGLNVALNTPYPGSYLIERHGRPLRGRHALQIEVSRDLYLDESLDQPGEGLPRIHAAMARLIEALVKELGRDRWSEAAE
ncbi:MAG: N-formylglutamate amidohydrolase [Sphingobium sp.]